MAADYDFNSLLNEGEKIRELHPMQVSELKNYINACSLANRGGIHTFWEEIKHNWVTDNFVTIWVLTDRFFKRYYSESAGMKYPPISLLQWILDNDKSTLK